MNSSSNTPSIDRLSDVGLSKEEEALHVDKNALDDTVHHDIGLTKKATKKKSNNSSNVASQVATNEFESIKLRLQTIYHKVFASNITLSIITIMTCIIAFAIFMHKIATISNISYESKAIAAGIIILAALSAAIFISAAILYYFRHQCFKDEILTKNKMIDNNLKNDSDYLLSISRKMKRYENTLHYLYIFAYFTMLLLASFVIYGFTRYTLIEKVAGFSSGPITTGISAVVSVVLLLVILLIGLALGIFNNNHNRDPALKQKAIYIESNELACMIKGVYSGDKSIKKDIEFAGSAFVLISSVLLFFQNKVIVPLFELASKNYSEKKQMKEAFVSKNDNIDVVQEPSLSNENTEVGSKTLSNDKINTK